MVLALVLSFAFGLHTADAATNNIASKSLLSLLSSHAVQVSAQNKATIYNTGYSSMNPIGSMLGSGSTQTMTINVDAGQDILTPGMVKATHQITISGSGSFGLLGSSTTLSVEDRIVGDTIYLQLPWSIFNLLTRSTSPIPVDTWVEITPSDIAALKTDFPAIQNVYNDLISFNSQPVQFLKDHQADWLKFTQALKLAKYSTKKVNGSSVTVYSFTLDKVALRQTMIDSAKANYMNGTVPAAALKSIDAMLANFSITNGYFSVYTATNLPSAISGTASIYNNTTKKLMTSDDFRISFSNYEQPLSPAIPPAPVTATQFYTQYIKPSLDAARQKAVGAKIKSELSNMRANAELIYDQTVPQGYGTVSNTGDCASPASGSVFNPTVSNGSFTRQMVSSIMTDSNNNARCYSTTTTWAMSAQIPNDGSFWCVDNTGASKSVPAQITGPACQ